MSLSQGPSAERNYKYNNDTQTGLSSFYNSSKFTVKPVNLQFEKDTKAKIYSVQPLNAAGQPEGSPILHVEFHAPSGSASRDQDKRDAAVKNLRETIDEYLKNNTQYKDVVYSMDANVSGVALKDGTDQAALKKELDERRSKSASTGDLIASHFETNKKPVIHLLEGLVPTGYVVEGGTTGDKVVLKERTDDMGDNQQLTKALFRDFGLKPYCVHVKVPEKLAEGQTAEQAREASITKLVDNPDFIKPTEIRVFGVDETYGSDHSQTKPLEVRGFKFVMFPFINSFGSRGYQDPNDLYTSLEDYIKTKDIRRAATHDFFDVIINELKVLNVTEVKIGKKKISIDDVMTRDKASVAERAEFISEAEKFILSQQSDILDKILKEFSQTENFKAWNNVLKNKKLDTDKSREECRSRIWNKNYSVSEVEKGKLGTHKSAESINIIVDKAAKKVSYSLKNAQGVIITGEIENFESKGERLDKKEQASLRLLIIEDARKKIKDQPQKGVKGDDFVLSLDEPTPGKTIIKIETIDKPKEGEEAIVPYSVVISGIQYSGSVKSKVSSTITDTEKQDLKKKIIAELTKLDIIISNGKDLVNQTAEFLNVQPFAGFPASVFKVHPRQAQLVRCAEIAKTADIVTSTDNSDFSMASGADKALADEIGYLELYKKQMTEVCAAVKEGREPKIELPKKPEKAAPKPATPASDSKPAGAAPVAGVGVSTPPAPAAAATPSPAAPSGPAAPGGPPVSERPAAPGGSPVSQATSTTQTTTSTVGTSTAGTGGATADVTRSPQDRTLQPAPSPVVVQLPRVQEGERVQIKELVQKTFRVPAEGGVNLEGLEAVGMEASLQDREVQKFFNNWLSEMAVQETWFKSTGNQVPIAHECMFEVIKDHNKKPKGPAPDVRVDTTTDGAPTDRSVVGTSRSTDSTPSQQTTASEPEKPAFPKRAVIGFAIAGGLIGAGISIAIIGLAWPVVIGALAAALVVGGARALYAKATESVPAASTAADVPSPVASPPAQEAGEGVSPSTRATQTASPAQPTADATAEAVRDKKQGQGPRQ